jgi:DNA-binding GntR family transcriptional regulator
MISPLVRSANQQPEFVARKEVNSMTDGSRNPVPVATEGHLQPMKAQTLADRCYEQLKNAILTLELRPGTPLSELQMANQLGISKSPVREAFQRLSRDGLVTLEPNRRCLVTGLDRTNIRDWYELRLILEPESLRRCGNRIEPALLDELRRVNDLAIGSCNQLDPLGFIQHSDLFHLTLVNLNPNQSLVAAVQDLFDKIRRVRIAIYQLDYLGAKPSFTIGGLNRHEQVIALLEQDQLDEAVNMLHADIETFIIELDNGQFDDALERVRFRKIEPGTGERVRGGEAAN